MKRLLLSQLIGLISATWETKRITADVPFTRINIPNEDGIHSIFCGSFTIKWENKVHCGSKEQELWLSCNKVKAEHCGENQIITPICYAYLYMGDNCNEYTVFLYKLMGDETAIIDDIGVFESNGKIGRRSLLNLSPSKHRHNQVNGIEETYK